MNKEELTQKIMRGLSESLNESKTLDLKENKDHKAAYNSFVKWYNRWKEKLGREEIRALVKKVSNDALGDNLDMINESSVPGDANENLAFDLFLWCENTREIRLNQCQAVINTLVRKIKLGKNLDEEYLANSGVVDRIARSTIETYRNEFPGTYVSSSTRKSLRAKIAHMLIEDAEEQIHFEELELNK